MRLRVGSLFREAASGIVMSARRTRSGWVETECERIVTCVRGERHKAQLEI